MPKIRADQRVVDLGLASSRQKAQALILARSVLWDQRVIEKAGQQIPDTAELSLKETLKWVSRGGLKLEKALNCFDLNVKDRVAIDLGASTGGFTHVLMEEGIQKVYAIDVGFGQFDWQLRQNPKIDVRERVNGRYIKQEEFDPIFDLIVCDASFISLKTILPAAMTILSAHHQQGDLIALIKPQFEVGKENVGKGGVVRDPELHKQCCQSISTWVSEHPHWQVKGIEESPITGPKGNKEFLLHGYFNRLSSL